MLKYRLKTNRNGIKIKPKKHLSKIKIKNFQKKN